MAAATVTVLLLAPVARSGTRSHLQKREQRQLASLHRHQGTITFFRHHPRLARTKIGRREVRRSRVWVRIIRRELAETRVQLHPPSPFAVPAWWLPGATCVHLHESVDWRWGPSHHPGQASWNGYFGGFQFVLSTWHSTYAPGEARGYSYDHPEAASVAEQYWRAFVNWQHNGSRFGNGQWPNSSRACGLR